MTTIIISALVAGVVLGGGLGWKLGRGYERMRPQKKTKKKKDR
jgi:membrane protein YqaA with SNARE-associated domain